MFAAICHVGQDLKIVRPNDPVFVHPEEQDPEMLFWPSEYDLAYVAQKAAEIKATAGKQVYLMDKETGAFFLHTVVL